MNAPAPITPPTGPYRVVSVRDTRLGAERGPFADRDEALRALRASVGPAVLVRGATVLEGRGVTSPATLTAIRARLAEGATATAEEPAPAPAAAPARSPREPRVGRPKPVAEGHCGGCGEAYPTHLTVCPLAPALLPGMAPPPPPPPACTRCGEPAPDHAADCPRASRAPEALAPTPEDPMTTTKTTAATPKRPRGRPRKTPVEAAPAAERAEAPVASGTHTCDGKKCCLPAADARPATDPALVPFCRRHRLRAYSRAKAWGVPFEAAAESVRNGTTERPERAAPNRQGHRPAARKVAKKTAATKAAKRPKAARVADPSDVLAREFAALVGDLRREVLALIPSRASVREVAQEVVVEAVQIFRGALS